MTWEKFKYALLHYIAGILSAGYNGGISAAAGIAGIDGSAIISTDAKAQLLTAHQMLGGFVGAFIIHALFWAKAHPLKESYDTGQPFFPPPEKPGATPPSLPNQ